MSFPQVNERVFLDAFEDGTLPAEVFDHTAHVRMAWLYLRDHPLPEAIGRINDGLRAYTAAIDHATKYHVTITWAFALIVHERMGAGKDDGTWRGFLSANPDLVTEGRAILLRHYRPGTLGSALARAEFVPPDRGTLPHAQHLHDAHVVEARAATR